MEINNRQKIINICFVILIVFFCIISIKLYKVNQNNKNTIQEYHNRMMNRALINIDQAVNLLDKYKANKKPNLLFQVASELDAASDFIQEFRTYYEYNSESISGLIIEGTEFFIAYKGVVNRWGLALQNEDLEKIPSDEQIEIYRKDIQEISNAFRDNFKEKKNTLSYEKLIETIFELVKKTKSEEVKSNFSKFVLKDKVFK
ncbi:MAG: hypothetical protein N4A63_00230 [Vallitalea sp.]|jgi:hypothetical protein|nr:hypothetical protein [Vallitalea sp.]